MTKAMSEAPAGKQFILNPSDLAAKGGGPGDYVIRLFSGQPKPVIVHKIKIKPWRGRNRRFPQILNPGP